MSYHNSPARVIWRRLKKNIPAMIGLGIIVIASVTAIFCYVFMPDNSPDANEMNLALSTQKPGFQTTAILVPRNSSVASGSLLKKVFTGFPSDYKFIPVDTLWISGDSVYYKEFSGDTNIAFPVESKSLQSFYNAHATNITITKEQQKEKFLEERVIEKTFLLGTDRFGRDLFSRLLAGTRVSMAVGMIAVLISLVIGITLGALAGFFRGKTDDFIMWLINVVWSIPTLLLVIAITMALGKGFSQVFIAVGLTMWVEVARVVRGQIFSIREMEFVEAGRALGFTNSRIIIRHILPNIMSPVIVIAASNFASAILLEAGLSFLGMGAQPPTPSWGMMIKENYGYIIVDAAYLAVYPGLAIMIMVLAFTWLGNGLRDAIDAKEGMGSRV
jgi:peptide/nickel transport system permease protein